MKSRFPDHASDALRLAVDLTNAQLPKFEAIQGGAATVPIT